MLWDELLDSLQLQQELAYDKISSTSIDLLLSVVDWDLDLTLKGYVHKG